MLCEIQFLSFLRWRELELLVKVVVILFSNLCFYLHWFYPLTQTQSHSQSLILTLTLSSFIIHRLFMQCNKVIWQGLINITQMYWASTWAMCWCGNDKVFMPTNTSIWKSCDKYRHIINSNKCLTVIISQWQIFPYVYVFIKLFWGSWNFIAGKMLYWTTNQQ